MEDRYSEDILEGEDFLGLEAGKNLPVKQSGLPTNLINIFARTARNAV